MKIVQIPKRLGSELSDPNSSQLYKPIIDAILDTNQHHCLSVYLL